MFAHDSSGNPVTGKVTGDWTKRISKDAGAFAAMTVTITEMENGWYSVPISTAHSDTLGILSMTFNASGVMQVNMQYRVHARIQDDLATQASVDTVDDFLDTEISAIKTKTDFLPSATAGAAGGLFIAGTNAATVVTTSFTTTFTGNLTGSVASVTAGVTLAAAAVQAIWDALTSALTTSGSIGKLIVDNLNAAITSRATPAQVNAEVVDALNVDTYAELVALPAAASSIVDRLSFIFALCRNKITQTGTTQNLRNDTDAGNIATTAVSDDNTTFIKGEWT